MSSSFISKYLIYFIHLLFIIHYTQFIIHYFFILVYQFIDNIIYILYIQFPEIEIRKKLEKFQKIEQNNDIHIKIKFLINKVL